jgi:hypothetical protein
MTDGVSNLGVGGANVNADPQITNAPTTPPAPTMTPQQAYARREELMRDPVWVADYLKGNPDKLKTMTELHAAMTNTKIHVGSDGIAPSRVADTLKNFAALEPEVALQAEQLPAVTAEEKQAAERLRRQLMSDREWVRKYFDGGIAERATMTKISIIKASPVKG